MDTDKLAFWGMALKPGEPADLDLQDGETLHVTMASLGVDLADEKGRSVITATLRDSSQKHGLSVLKAGTTESCIMDVSFVGEESITFEVSGKNVVHLVGNFAFEDDMSDSDDSSDEEGPGLIGVYDSDSDDMDSDSDDDEAIPDPRLLVNRPPVITEVTEEEEKKDKVSGTHKKNKGKDGKGKLPNGKQKAESKNDTPKQTKKSISFMKPEDESEEESEVSEEESGEESEQEVDDIKPTGRKAKKGSKKSKASPEEGEDEIKNANDDDSSKNAKGKKNRKRKATIVTEPTSPTPKKSKISQRPGTPAAVKSSQKTPKVEGHAKEGKKKSANGTPTPPPQDKSDADGDSGSASKSGKKKRRRSKRGGGSA